MSNAAQADDRSPHASVFHTARLTLVAATAAHLEAELADVERFAALVDATVPASWPPGEYDASAQRFFLERLGGGGPAAVGWYGWYAVRRPDAKSSAMLVASGGYFGPPDGEGAVEIGFSVCPEWRGRGYATELAAGLAEHAAQHPGVQTVLAHTRVENGAARRVLERAAFVVTSVGTEPGILRFEYVVCRS